MSPDNNACYAAERILKRAILHRKNSLFYKTLAGARFGDLFMSLIHSAELSKVNPCFPGPDPAHWEDNASLRHSWMNRASTFMFSRSALAGSPK